MTDLARKIAEAVRKSLSDARGGYPGLTMEEAIDRVLQQEETVMRWCSKCCSSAWIIVLTCTNCERSAERLIALEDR